MDIMGALPGILIVAAICGIYAGAMRAWRHDRRRALAVRDESGFVVGGSLFGDGGDCGGIGGGGDCG